MTYADDVDDNVDDDVPAPFVTQRMRDNTPELLPGVPNKKVNQFR